MMPQTQSRGIGCAANTGGFIFRGMAGRHGQPHRTILIKRPRRHVACMEGDFRVCPSADGPQDTDRIAAERFGLFGSYVRRARGVRGTGAFGHVRSSPAGREHDVIRLRNASPAVYPGGLQIGAGVFTRNGLYGFSA
ncbi:hypothetical protein AA21952_2598 [Acetobacter oeni LMG 21952]|nr:hypothetical protein AA21952_2598 [Acetobacter oeni LMG 21952]